MGSDHHCGVPQSQGLSLFLEHSMHPFLFLVSTKLFIPNRWVDLVLRIRSDGNVRGSCFLRMLTLGKEGGGSGPSSSSGLEDGRVQVWMRGAPFVPALGCELPQGVSAWESCTLGVPG